MRWFVLFMLAGVAVILWGIAAAVHEDHVRPHQQLPTHAPIPYETFVCPNGATYPAEGPCPTATIRR